MAVDRLFAEVTIRNAEYPIPTLYVPRSLANDDFAKACIALRDQYATWHIEQTNCDRVEITFESIELVVKR